MKTIKTIFFAFTIIIALASCNDTNKQEEIIGTKAINTTKPLSDLSIYNLPSVWTTQNGEDIELKVLKGDVIVMVMIYTSCKAACPRLVADMRAIEAEIPES